MRSRSIDIVFCVDVTSGMEQHIERIKQQIKSFSSLLMDSMEKLGMTDNCHVIMRVRLITFTDYLTDGENAILGTDFYNLEIDDTIIWSVVDSQLTVRRGFGDRKAGYEAISYAMKSDWYTEYGRRRRIIVLWSNGSPRKLGLSLPTYPPTVIQNFEELTTLWNELDMSKRLILFTPDVEGWRLILDNWENVIQFPSLAGYGLDERTLVDEIVGDVLYC